MSGINQTLRVRLREERLRRGWTQAELAGRIGKCDATISYWEAGRRGVGLQEIDDLALVLDIDPLDLLRPAVEGGDSP